MKSFVVTTLLVVCSSIVTGQTYKISTMVGTENVFGDGGLAAMAALIQPVGVAADKAGNIYISDETMGRIRKIDAKTGMISTLSTVASSPAGIALDSAGAFLYVADDGNHRVRKIDTTTGATTTVAGTGSGGFSGDGHLATQARFRNPKAVWVDSSNNIFIADTKNNRIRKVDGATGIIRTIAGKGGQNATVSAPSGADALASSNVAGDGGKAIEAQLANPEGVVGDAAGNIYIADTNFNRIRKVDTHGTISTVAGRGTSGSTDATNANEAELNAPRGLALNSRGNLYIADSGNNRVRELIVATNVLRTFAGAGSAGDDKQAQIAALNFPSGIAFGASGDLLIADQNNSKIRMVDAKTHLIRSLTGSTGAVVAGGPAASAGLSNPSGVALDSQGNIYVADTANQRIRKISSTGMVSAFAGTGSAGNGPVGTAVVAKLNFPGCVAVDSSDNVLIADRVNSKIRRVGQDGVMSNVVSADSGVSDKKGRVTYTSASGYNGDGSSAILSRLNMLTGATGSQHLSPTGAVLGGDGILSAGKSNNTGGPNCLSVDKLGNIYVADTGNNVIRKVDASGVITTVVGYPTVVIDKDGLPVNTGVAGSGGDGGLATEAQLNRPQGVGVDPDGNFLCIADTGNHVVRQVNLAANTIVTIAGITSDGSSDKNLPGPGFLSRLNGPQGCAMDATGNTFIADTGNNRILEVDAAGEMSVIAGGGSTIGSDGMKGTDAQLFMPVGIAAGANGAVYFTDRSGLIKKLARTK